ncbi:uncharacterized protein LY79DRAFT_553590 [Colletotrichum navitas]|uniref:Uncharacterized protein n=1 Tax=Colletotrichum navitas TaxID=681940 RepID=A0AAD8Q048_9PEZI|nr:uncharacterized protein LY79DRAFT_553590 [Colletotrichum navitas]KAK1590917.1 hypothetical protein LY79DRAFT_553590 [Colletotrichum navitas]
MIPRTLLLYYEVFSSLVFALFFLVPPPSIARLMSVFRRGRRGRGWMEGLSGLLGGLQPSLLWRFFFLLFPSFSYFFSRLSCFREERLRAPAAM